MKKWLLVLTLFIVLTIAILLLREDIEAYISPAQSPIIISSTTPTATLTLTPSPTFTITPTHTPTPNPTPLGKSGIFIFEKYTPQCFETAQDELFCEGQIYDGIYSYNFFNEQTTQIFSSEKHLEGISPNGKRLLISKGSDLISVSPDGMDEILLADNFYPNDYKNMSSAFWVPDLDQIIYRGLANKIGQLFLVHPSGKNEIQITNTTKGVDYLIQAYYNSNIIWEESGRYFQGYQTNIETLDTSSYPDKCVFKTFSRDGNLVVDYEKETIEGVGFSYPDPSLSIRVIDNLNNMDVRVNLTEEFGLGKDYPCSIIENAWVNNNDETLLLFIRYCDENQRYIINDYLLLDKSGLFIKHVTLPIEESEYSLPPNPTYFIYESKPEILMSNYPWSPDGKLLLFLSHFSGRIIVADILENNFEEYEFPKGFFPGIIHNAIWLPSSANY